jgi:hypothetical protein
MQESNPVGRPTKYKEEYNEQAYKLCLLGFTDKELADFFKVAESSINLWKEEYPEFSESIRKGKEFADMNVVSSLYDSTKDRVVVEQQAIKTKRVYYNTEGKRIEEEKVEVVDLEKVIPSDFRSQQFWLKNRRAMNWRDKQEIEHSGKIAGATELTDEELEVIRKIKERSRLNE